MNTNSIKSYNLRDYFLSRVQEILNQKKKKKRKFGGCFKISQKSIDTFWSI